MNHDFSTSFVRLSLIRLGALLKCFEIALEMQKSRDVEEERKVPK